MKCDKCGAQLRAGSRFCTQCGLRVLLVCPSCKRGFEAEDLFCAYCGHQLAEVEKLAPAAAYSLENDTLYRLSYRNDNGSRELYREELHGTITVVRNEFAEIAMYIWESEQTGNGGCFPEQVIGFDEKKEEMFALKGNIWMNYEYPYSVISDVDYYREQSDIFGVPYSGYDRRYVLDYGRKELRDLGRGYCTIYRDAASKMYVVISDSEKNPVEWYEDDGNTVLRRLDEDQLRRLKDQRIELVCLEGPDVLMR